jgi:hypothetical protein
VATRVAVDSLLQFARMGMIRSVSTVVADIHTLTGQGLGFHRPGLVLEALSVEMTPLVAGLYAERIGRWGRRFDAAGV